MVEVKWNTKGVSIAAAGVTSVPYVELINPDIVGGTGKTGRIGNKIKYKRMTFAFDFQLGSTIGAFVYAAITMRVLIIQPRVVFTTIPIAADIFDTTSYLSPVKGFNFRVLFDKMKTLTPQGLATVVGSDPMHFMRRLHFRINNNVNYKDGVTSLPTAPKDLYYVVITSSLQGFGLATYSYQGQWSNRVSFIDI